MKCLWYWSLLSLHKPIPGATFNMPSRVSTEDALRKQRLVLYMEQVRQSLEDMKVSPSVPVRHKLKILNDYNINDL